jgi:SSS family transporter
MSTETIILIGVAIYVVIMIALGVYASTKSHTVTEFAVAGRSLPLWLCTATVIATWFGGGVMIGVAGSAYEDGMLGVIADPIGGSIALVLVGLFFVRLFRRLRLFSWVEVMEQRYGTIAGIIASAAALMSMLMWVAGMLVAFGIIFETLTGVPMVIGIVGGALIVVVYTSLGGMLAVALTDFVQMIIIAIGLVMLLVVVLIDVGGWSAIADKLPENTFRLVPVEHSFDAWLLYIRAWLILGLADIASQSLLQRAMSSKTELVAQNAFYLAAIGYFMLGMIPVLLGIIASVTMPNLAIAESVVPSLALEHLHPVAIAVFVGALLAAIMSSCDSAILAAATVFSTNILPRLMPKPSERAQLIAIRLGIPGAGLVAVVIALNSQVVFDTVLDANMLVLAAVIAPFILAVWWKKANRVGALSAMGAGMFAWLIVSYAWPEQPADLIGFGFCLATMLIVTPLTQRIDPPRGLVDHEGKPVELRDRLGILRR